MARGLAAEGVPRRLPGTGTQLDPDKTVGENVEEASRPESDAQPVHEISMKFAEPMTDEKMNACSPAGRPSDQDRAARMAGTSDRRVNIALDALRCPPADAPSPRCPWRAAARRAVGCAGKADCCCLTNRQPLDAESVAWLEPSCTTSPARHDRDHDRYSSTTTGWILEMSAPRLSVRGQLLVLARTEAQRLQQEEKEEERAQRHGDGAGMDRRIAACPAAKNRARIRAMRSYWQSRRSRWGVARDHNPARSAPGNGWSRRGLRRARQQLLIDDLSFKLPPGGIVVLIGRMAPARHAVPHDHRPGAAGAGSLRVGKR